MGTGYSVVGLLCDITGAWLLAYEILWGYPRHNRALTIQCQLTNLEQHLAHMLSFTDGLSDPPYTQQEKDLSKKQLHDKWDPTIDELGKELESLGEGHRTTSFYIALLGILFLSVGFVLQIVGVIKSSGA